MQRYTKDIQDYELVGSFDNQRFPNISPQRSINLFEYIDPEGKKPKALISTSGLANTNISFPNASGGFRAEFVLGEFEYLVIGDNIYRRDQFNTITQLNSSPLPTSSGYVGVDANNADFPQILFVDGQVGCIWDTGSQTFTFDIRNTVDPAFPIAPLDVCFIDGFLLVANGGSQLLSDPIPTNSFQLSAYNNAYSWGLVSSTFTADSTTDELTLPVARTIPTGSPIEFTAGGGLPTPLVAGTTYYAIFVDSTHIKVATTYANALAGTAIDITTNGTAPNTITNDGIPGAPGQLQEGFINSHPGPIVACRTLHRRVFLFSKFYTEVWENAGQGTNLPLRRNNSLLMEYGTPAIGSIATGFDKMVFLSQDRDGLGAVMQVSGTEAVPISNEALDYQLAQYASNGQVADARALFVKENGIIFYRLNFTAANHTYVYNLTYSQLSGRRLWHEEEVLNGDRHPAQTHGYFNGNNFVGNYHLPILYQLDNSFITNDGEIIPRIRIGRNVVPATYNRTRIDRYMVDIIQGLTDITNLDSIIDLLTESGNVIITESGINIILEQSNSGSIINPDNHVIFLSVSKDGGVTYSYRQEAIIGGTGRRTTRTVWRKLGTIPRGQGFIPKVEFFGNVPLIVLGAAWAFEIMPE